MFELNLNDDDILMKITATKPVTNKDVVTNFVGNLIANASLIGGDIADKVHIILSKDSIYLEYMGHNILGNVKETRGIDRILLNELKEFSVDSKEDAEYIKIITTKDEFNFVKNNSKKDDLALAMSRVINDIK